MDWKNQEYSTLPLKTDDKIMVMNYIRGITVPELSDKVSTILSRNAPVDDPLPLKAIIHKYDIQFDVNAIANNELRVLMFDSEKDTFTDGDDAVRWLCHHATEKMLLIKSSETISAMKTMACSGSIPVNFLENHAMPLAQVFNRHKKLILALKNESSRTIINTISRMSKVHHVPLRESINKSFIAKALNNEVDKNVLDKVSLRDKFKYLNILEYKSLENDIDIFIIRNGKTHIEQNRTIYNKTDIKRVKGWVLSSIRKDMKHLKKKNILLDAKVHYALPISRKQTIGQLPFGTKIVTGGTRISSGIFWKNEWGASDLDLSTIDVDGSRTGWGQISGYDRRNPITYSGDVTYADGNGAMEFMTSANKSYGLFVNVFTGENGCETEIVIGSDNNKETWITDPIIREKTTLDSKNMILGFVNDSEFIVWKGRNGNNRVSGHNGNIYASRGLAKFWTINELLEYFKIPFSLDKEDDVVYDYDLTYGGFSLDKLEEMLDI